MATIGELIVSFQGDPKGLQNATQVAAQSLRNLVKEAQKAGKDLTDFNNQQINLLKGWKNELGQAYGETLEALEPIKKSLVEQGKATSVAQKGINGLAIQEVIAAQRSLELSSSLNEVSSSLWVLTMGIQQAGRALTKVFTVPLAGIATVAVKTFSDWEHGAKMLQASADLTNEKTEELTKSFRELALVMPVTVKEFLEIARASAEAGVGADNIERYTIAIGKLVTISDELNPEQAAETLISISRAFGIAEENVERTASVLRKMAKEARGGMDDFIAATLRAIPAATTLSISFQDLSAMLAAIIPVTGTASRAGTQLNTMFDNMSRNLPKLAAQMGITEEALKEMVGRDAVSALKTYIDGLKVSEDQIEKNQAVLEVFGATGAKALRALINQYDEFGKRQVEANEAFREGTELTKDYEIVAGSLQSQFKQFGNAVLEVTKVIGDDLAPVVREVMNRLIKMIQAFAAVWVALPDDIKKAAINLGIFLAVLGPLLLALNTVLSTFIGLFTTVAKLSSLIIKVKTLFTALGAAAGTMAAGGLGALLLVLGKIILIAALAAAAIYLVYKALDRLFGIGEKIKNALGITDFQERLADAKDKIKASFGEIGDSAQEAAQKIERSMAGLAILATGWGDKIMESFLYGFREADFGILDSAMKIVESYMDVLEKQGTITAEGIYSNTVQARREIAKAIAELKDLSGVSTETQKALEGLVGAARTESILKQISAAIRVEDIQETLDSLNTSLKSVKNKMREQIEVLDDAIKEQKNKYEDQIDVQEDAIKLLETQKKLLGRAYRTELRIYEDEVDVLEERKEVAQDALDATKDANRLALDSLEEQRDALRENRDATREALDDLKELRKDEVDAAEGMLDYAKMNLEASKNQLAKEKALGKDEWDVSFRAAEERYDVASDQVDLAYGTYLRTKQLYKKEEDVLEDQIDLQDDAIKVVDRQLRNAKYAAEQQEKVFEEQLDLAKDSLDESKDALRDFKNAYNNQKDILSDQIEVHQDIVDDLRGARDEIVRKLQDERDALEDKYDAEIRIFDERVRTAQTALDTTKELLAQEKGINDQRLQLERERLAAAQAMGGDTAFPDIAAGDGGTYDALLEQLANITSGYNDISTAKDAALGGGGGGSWGEDELSWWETLRNSFNTVVSDMKTAAGTLWDDIKVEWEKVDFSQTWQTIRDTFNVDELVTKIQEINWGQVGANIGTALQTGLQFVSNLGTQIYSNIIEGLNNLGPSLQSAGEWIGDTIASGISGAREAFKNAGDVVYGIADALNEKWDEIKGWGKSVGEQFAYGIGEAWDTVKDRARNLIGAISAAINDKWDDLRSWGKSVAEQLGYGLGTVYDTIRDTAKSLVSAVYNGFVYDRWSDFWNWGKQIADHIASGIYGAYDAIRDAASWIADVFKDFLGWFSPPKEGPMSDGDKWMPNMMKTLAKGMVDNVNFVKGAANKVGNVIGESLEAVGPVVGTSVVANAQSAFQGVAARASGAEGSQQGGLSEQTIINLQPGMMIASKGEVRAFVRMIAQVQNTEKERTGIEE